MLTLRVSTECVCVCVCVCVSASAWVWARLGVWGLGFTVQGLVAFLTFQFRGVYRLYCVANCSETISG